MKTEGWRSWFRIHPLADELPLMPEPELKSLAEDIRAYGLRVLIDCRMIDDEREILDGRNRLDAIQLAGIKLTKKSTCFRELVLNDEEAAAHVRSLNVERRHLNTKDKQKFIDALLKAHPGLSDRKIAESAKVDHKTVGARRAKMKASGEIPQSPEELARKARVEATLARQKAAADKEWLQKNDHQVAEFLAAIKAYKEALILARKSVVKFSPEAVRFAKRKLAEIYALDPFGYEPDVDAIAERLDAETARRIYVRKCREDRRDIDAEIDLVTDELREIEHAGNDADTNRQSVAAESELKASLE